MINYKTKNLSDKFYNNGLVIEPEENKNILNLKTEDIISIFEQKGIIVFRDFELEASNILKFTDKFTKVYAADAPRRDNLYDKKNINTVDLGFHEMPLHSEASYSPSWPEILWFYCVKSPKEGGETTICDGISLWKSLSQDVKDFFLSNPITFDLEFPVVKKINKLNKRPWSLNALGSSHGIIDYSKGVFTVKQTRFAVTESRIDGQLAFVNHLMIIFENEPQIKKIGLTNGDPIPKEIQSHILEKSNDLIHDINWDNSDLVMLDNRRFLHGRRSYTENVERKIINVQTLKANFSYGASTR